MTQRQKNIVLLFLIVALISILLLASSLSNLQLRAGTPFPGSGDSDHAVQNGTTLSPAKNYSFSLLQGVFAFIFLVLIIYLPARLTKLVNLKVLLRSVFILGLLLAIVYMLPRLSPGQTKYIPNEISEVTPLPPFDYPVTPLGKPPQVLIILVVIGSLLGVGLLIFILFKRQIKTIKIEDQLLREAEQALAAIKTGMDFRNVILQCYIQMSHSLWQEQGIEREYNMTAREFEELLGSKGFPSAPVHQLTILFENVRYGYHQMSDSDEMIAIQSLNEIIDFCRIERD